MVASPWRSWAEAAPRRRSGRRFLPGPGGPWVPGRLKAVWAGFAPPGRARAVLVRPT